MNGSDGLTPEIKELTAQLSDLHGKLRKLADDLHPVAVYYRARFWAVIQAAMTFSLGLVLVFGGPRRVSASAYWLVATAGGPIAWGTCFIVTALLNILAVWKCHGALRWTVLIQAFGYAGLAFSFLVAAITFPDANLTAAPIYGWISIALVFLSDWARKEF